MIFSFCPSEEVRAPAGVVWRLLTTPADYGDFWDLNVHRVKPPGRAAAGQRITGSTRALCRRWPVAGDIIDVDETRHVIQFRMVLPFGVVSDNRMSCVPLDAASCLVRFG